MRTFEQTKKDVVGWAIDRKIIQNAKPETQLLKAISEIGELSDATIKNNADDMVDAVAMLYKIQKSSNTFGHKNKQAKEVDLKYENI